MILPTTGTFGDREFLPNLFRPTYRHEGLSLSKVTRIKEHSYLEFQLEAFNVFNRVILASPNANISNPTSFGTITSQANSPGNAQLVLKLTF